MNRADTWLAAGALLGVIVAARGILVRDARGAPLPPDAVATVNGEPILRSEYERVLAATTPETRRAPDTATRKRVLDRLIDEELLVQRGIELDLPERDARVRADLGAAVIDLAVARGEAEDATPDEATLARFYAANRDFFRRAPALSVTALYFTDRARADDAAARLRGGARPDAIVGDTAPVALPAGIVPLSKLEQYLGANSAERLAKLDAGAVSGPEPDGAGYRVLRVVARRPGEAPPLAAVRDAVRREYVRRAGERHLAHLLDDRRKGATIRIAAGAP